jgi:3-hydroxyisobutyrate dehydrogenase
MGQGMAGRLLEAGHQLTVFNRTPEKADALVRRGARLAASPREAADGAEAVFVMVSDDEGSRAVWTGADGVLAGDLAPQAFAVECSTVSHDWVTQLGSLAGARGLRFLDSPVTGLPDAAAAGELTLLIGAADADLAAAAPLLRSLASDWLHFGPVGAGTAYKLIINLMGAVQIAAAAEGLALAERAGLDLDQVAHAIASGQAASPQVVRNSGGWPTASTTTWSFRVASAARTPTTACVSPTSSVSARPSATSRSPGSTASWRLASATPTKVTSSRSLAPLRRAPCRAGHAQTPSRQRILAAR